MFVVCIKERQPYGLVLARYDVQNQRWVGPIILALKSDKGGFARQLAKAIEQFEKEPGTNGITDDLANLCIEHDIPLNVEWTIYTTRK